MTNITNISRRDFRMILKQAQREQEAQDRGYECHAHYVEAHREERRQTLRSRARCA